MNGTTNPKATATSVAEDSVRTVWTSKDEANLRELMLRRERVMTDRRMPVTVVAKALFDAAATKSGELGQVTAMADELIARAGQTIEALRPFADLEDAS